MRGDAGCVGDLNIVDEIMEESCFYLKFGQFGYFPNLVLWTLSLLLIFLKLSTPYIYFFLTMLWFWKEWLFIFQISSHYSCLDLVFLPNVVFGNAIPPSMVDDVCALFLGFDC